MKNVVAAVGTCLAFLALFSLLGRSTSNEPVANNASMVEMNSPLHNRSTGSTTKREKRDAGVWDECASSTSVELFKDCAKAYHAERKEEAAFLFFAAQIRGRSDISAYPPVGQGGSHPGHFISRLRHDIGWTINPYVMRNHEVYQRTVERLRMWQPKHDASYEPGWKYKRRMDPTEADALVAKSKNKIVKQMDKMSGLLNDPEYTELFATLQDQNFDVERIREITGDQNYQMQVLSKRQLEDLNRRALKVENKHGYKDVFGRKPGKTELPKKWNDQIDALREKLK